MTNTYNSTLQSNNADLQSVLDIINELPDDDINVMNKILNRSFTEINNSAKSIGRTAFAGCNFLEAISFPACTSIGAYAFADCSSLTTISFPACTYIGDYAFSGCYSLKNVDFPSCKYVGDNAFYRCTSLTTVSLPACTGMGYYVFNHCYHLKSLYLMGSSMCSLPTTNTLGSTPIYGYTASAGTYGSIYVPASLLTSYKNATNWTYFSSRFVGI